LDPSLNIPPPKEGEKTMKDFCSKFKIPKEAREASRPTPKANETANAPPPPADEEKDERSAPFVEMINGEIVIKESSMIVGGRRTTEEVDRELEGAVVEEENEGITATYNSFTKRQKTSRWTVEETKNFFLALRQCGTDFSTMESFFTGEDGTTKRTRKQLKSKYLRETKKNLKLIDMAMNPAVQLPLDLSVFGELDMDAVKDTVVPLGQATASPAPLNLESSSGKKRKASSSPSVVTQTQEYEMEEIVEDASEKNRKEAFANENRNTVAQDDVHESTNMDEDPTTSRSTETIATATESPLVVPVMKAKKQQRPKFRVKAKPNPSKSLKAKAGKK
jgi:transcription factor TFIIIB component B''